jgi:hypothetical protein
MSVYPVARVGILLSFGLLSVSAWAQSPITWGPPTTISTDADVSTYGTLFGAINNGGTDVQGVFVNAVPFSPFPTNGTTTTQGNFTLSSPQFSASGFTGEAGPNPGPGISSNYQTLLGSSSFVSGGSPLFVKISNLTVGQLYQVQVWANDSRSGGGKPRSMPLSGGGGNSVSLKVNDTGLGGGRGQYAIGTFTATAPDAGFSIGPGTNEFGPFSLLTAVQVRALPPSPPPQLSNRGFYRGNLPVSTGGNLLLFVQGNGSIAAYAASHNKFSSGGGTVAADGSFSFTMSLPGTSISGQITPDTISGSYTATGFAPESFNAARGASSGPASAVAGKYEGVVDGRGKFTILIEPTGRLTVAGVNQNDSTTVGGGGQVNLQTGNLAALANRAADWAPDDVEDAGSPKFNGTFNTAATGYENEIVAGSFNVCRGVLEGNIGGKFRGVRESAPNHLANISTRGTVTNTDRGQVIGGFIIQNGPKLVLIRGLGPSLVNAGIPEALTDPNLQLYSGQTLLAENDDWQTNSNASDITATSIPPSNAKEAALLIRLEPGTYTAVLSGKGGTGIALVEVYEIIRD